MAKFLKQKARNFGYNNVSNVDEAIKRIKEHVEYLLHHNKNLTKT